MSWGEASPLCAKSYSGTFGFKGNEGFGRAGKRQSFKMGEGKVEIRLSIPVGTRKKTSDRQMTLPSKRKPQYPREGGGTCLSQRGPPLQRRRSIPYCFFHFLTKKKQTKAGVAGKKRLKGRSEQAKKIGANEARDHQAMGMNNEAARW